MYRKISCLFFVSFLILAFINGSKAHKKWKHHMHPGYSLGVDLCPPYGYRGYEIDSVYERYPPFYTGYKGYPCNIPYTPASCPIPATLPCPPPPILPYPPHPLKYGGICPVDDGYIEPYQFRKNWCGCQCENRKVPYYKNGYWNYY